MSFYINQSTLPPIQKLWWCINRYVINLKKNKFFFGYNHLYYMKIAKFSKHEIL